MEYYLELYEDNKRSAENILWLLKRRLKDIQIDCKYKHYIDSGIKIEISVPGEVVYPKLRGTIYRIDPPCILAIGDKDIKYFKDDLDKLFIKNKVYDKIENLFFYNKKNINRLVEWLDKHNFTQYELGESYSFDDGYKQRIDIKMEKCIWDTFVDETCWMYLKDGGLTTNVSEIFDALMRNNISRNLTYDEI